MFILDTNVLSELMSAHPMREVIAWAATQPHRALHTTAISQAEIFAGLAILPEGRRRADLETAAQTMFRNDFTNRILPFDSAAAINYAFIFARRRRVGRPASALDLMIAAIAKSNDAVVVTRDVAGFAESGVEVINPWFPAD